MGTTRVTAEPGLPFVDIEREFDAPRELIYRAFTEPELLVQWLGPRRYRMTIDRYDVRDGGSWRYVHSDDSGNAFGFHGVFHGEPSMDGMLQTFEFEGAPGHVSLDQLRLEEHDGRTVVRTHSVFQSVADRDAMIENGMEYGVREGHERLEELLGRLVTVA
jgi:uncharacterized protein YndB with AHSA1/START domain